MKNRSFEHFNSIPQNNEFYESFYCLGELIKQSVSELSKLQSEIMMIGAFITGNLHAFELRIK